MPSEIIQNALITYLQYPMQPTDTSLTVVPTTSYTSPTGWPTIGNFRINIENEIMLVTSVSGFVWNVTRAVEQCLGVKLAVGHLAGVPVYSVLTTAALNNSFVGSSQTISFTQLQNETASTILGNPTGSPTTPTAISVGSGFSFANSTLSYSVPNGTLTYAQVQNESSYTLLGNPTGGAAAPSEITVGTGFSFANATLSYSLPNSGVTAGSYSSANITVNANGTISAASNGSGGGGGVTSVGLSDSSGVFNVANSPITSSGTLTLSLANESANAVLAGPASGSAAAPTFRALDIRDIPVPSGTIIPYVGYSAPNGVGPGGGSAWLLCNGQAINRTTYSALQSALTFTFTANATNSSGTITAVSASIMPQLGTGMAVESSPTDSTHFPRTVQFNANLASGGTSLTSCNNFTFLQGGGAAAIGNIAAGMLIFDPNGNLPPGLVVNTASGTTVNLARWSVTTFGAAVYNSAAKTARNMTKYSWASALAGTANTTYYAIPAISTAQLSGTSFALSNVGGTSFGGVLTFTAFPFGNGDSSTTFNVPDLRERFPLGSGLGYGNAAPNQTTFWHPIQPIGALSDNAVLQASNLVVDGVANSTANVSVVDQQSNLPLMPPYLTVNWLIKT